MKHVSPDVIQAAFAQTDPLSLEAKFLAEPAPPVAQAAGWLEAACAAEARIMTPDGPRPAGTLRRGDRVTALGLGPIALVWTSMRRVRFGQMRTSPGLAPVSLPPHALGGGAPRRPLRLSPRAGVLIEAQGGPAEGVLVPADALTGRGGCEICQARDVDYVQLVTERHAIIAADGVLVETLHPAALTETDPARAAIAAVLPEIGHDATLYGPDFRPRAVPA
ncbi:MAG: Hint domain-containing protein [Pseudomonadota bacterium]